jgi:hypothetical protein
MKISSGAVLSVMLFIGVLGLADVHAIRSEKVSNRLATAPRLGKYNIYSYGAGTNRLFLGHFELQAGGN